jgi:hypothetical protein
LIPSITLGSSSAAAELETGTKHRRMAALLGLAAAALAAGAGVLAFASRRKGAHA